MTRRSQQSPEQRRQLWLSLLRRVTASCPSAVLWKNADAGISGSGDVDVSASAAEWPAMEALHLEWSAANELGPVVVCRHLPSTLLLVTLEGKTSELLELDVKSRVTFKGSTVFRAEQLLPLSELDERGFRSLRPGAEGLLKLVIKGGTRGGRPHDAVLDRERVRQLIGQDRAGAALAGALLGGAAPAAAALVAAAAEGRWDRRAMLSIEARAGLRALSEPGILYQRVRLRRLGRTCPVVAALSEGRRVPGDGSDWLSSVAASHLVNGVRSIL